MCFENIVRFGLMAESLTVGRNGRADTPPENAARHFEKIFSALSRSPMQRAGLASGSRCAHSVTVLGFSYETTAIAYRDTFGARLRRRYITACPRRTSSPILQNLVFGTHTPLTAASTLTNSKVCADHPFVRSAVHTQRKTERRCYAPGLLKPR